MKGSRYRTTIRCSSKLSGYTAMPHSQLVQAHADREVEEEASAVLAAMGLTISDAVRLLLTRVAREKAASSAESVGERGGQGPFQRDLATSAASCLMPDSIRSVAIEAKPSRK